MFKQTRSNVLRELELERVCMSLLFPLAHLILMEQFDKNVKFNFNSGGAGISKTRVDILAGLKCPSDILARLKYSPADTF